jgi:3-hydroxyisobutyrate dehydrogenase-like beta-hydroxyacid dehydrogenase
MLSPRDTPEAPVTDAGFVGLGVMGSALSSHLLAAGWTVTGYDVDPARMAEHERRGGRLADSPAGAAAHADVIVTSLPTAGALREVARGLAATSDRTVIETSTLPVADKREARDLLASHGTVLLDCPRSGTGPAMAAANYSGPGVRTTVFGKDLEIIAEFARELGSPTPLFAVASAFYQVALGRGRGDEDAACIHAVLRELAGSDRADH